MSEYVLSYKAVSYREASHDVSTAIFRDGEFGSSFTVRLSSTASFKTDVERPTIRWFGARVDSGVFQPTIVHIREKKRFE